MSESALELIEREKRERTGRLDLGFCSLNEIPAEVLNLDWLKELYAIEGYDDYLENKSIEGENCGHENKILKVSNQIHKLEQLEVLYLQTNRFGYHFEVESLSALAGLKSLKKLVLDSVLNCNSQDIL